MDPLDFPGLLTRQDQYDIALQAQQKADMVGNGKRRTTASISSSRALSTPD